MATDGNRNKHGQRISKHTGKRLPSKRTLHNKIALLEQQIERLRAQLQEHLEVV